MKKIFITGGGKRLGKGLAEQFAANGHSVAISFSQSKQYAEQLIDDLRSKYDTDFYATQVELTQETDIVRGLTDLVENFGLPDVVINNAGVFPNKSSLKDLTLVDWTHTLNVNLTASMLVSREYIKCMDHFDNKTLGRIINIASLGGLEIWNKRLDYNVSKSALIQLTKGLARELAPRVSVNCVAPGSILLPPLEGKEDIPFISTAKIPMGRHGSLQDVFDAVNFFATASHYITGQTIAVDGGQHYAK